MEIKFFATKLEMLAFYNENKRLFRKWKLVDTPEGFALSFKQ